MLKLNGCFLAGIATHPSAEPGTLVVRCEPDERALLIEDAPEIYYTNAHYRKHPVVLIRLERVNEDVVRELLTVSWRITAARASKPERGKRRP